MSHQTPHLSVKQQPLALALTLMVSTMQRRLVFQVEKPSLESNSPWTKVFSPFQLQNCLIRRLITIIPSQSTTEWMSTILFSNSCLKAGCMILMVPIPGRWDLLGSLVKTHQQAVDLLLQQYRVGQTHSTRTMEIIRTTLGARFGLHRQS